MTSSLRSLYTDPTRTLEVLREFIQQSDERQVIINWLKNALTQFVEAARKHEEVRVLGIGSGSGEVDRCVLHQLVSKYSRVYNRVIEPDKMQINSYRKLIRSDSELASVEFDFRQQTSDQYLESSCNNKSSSRFDIIHMIQVLYYVDDIENTILQLYDTHLNENGVMIIIHVSGSRAWYRFNKRYENTLPVFRHDNSTGLDIEAVLEKHHIKYQRTILPSYLIIDECFNKDSQVGRLVFDYITETNHTVDTAPNDLLQDLMQYLKSPDCSYLREDRRVFENDLDVFWIHK
ncbi:histamine N-methyltransferase-like [Ptychodera flava]|uniref:histamine N-methyltransferase-like n=1 Tax=Ptychodera flava TaxID=63121 RepID=UPI00396A8D7A